MDYNVNKGMNYRGRLVVSIYKSLVKSKDLKHENTRLAGILGWCIEMLTASLIVNDDIMDNSVTRRGDLCWYNVEGVGLSAINDALLLENAVYALLKKHLRNTDCYVELMELFHEIMFIVFCGQTLDSLNAKKPVTAFTMETYKATVANKRAHFCLYLPFTVAIQLAG